MNDSRLGRWVSLQSRLLQGDNDNLSKPVRFTIERKDGEVINEFPADLENLPQVMTDALLLQGEELPQGSHQFRVVAYDAEKKQLSELPQTIKGSNRDATAAAHEAIQLQRASSMALHNMDFAATHLRSEFDGLRQRYDDVVEDRSLLLDTLNELRTSNFSQQLELQRFTKSQERLDKIVEAMGGIVTLAAPMLLKKFAPELAGDMVGVIQQLKQAPPPEAKPDEQPTAVEPASPAGAIVPKPRQAALPRSPKRGSEANRRNNVRADRSRSAKPKARK